jgi:cobalt-zinc-cadmium efflux system outer membrane protein
VALILTLSSAMLGPQAAQAAPGALTLERALALSLSSPKVLAAREAMVQARADSRTAGMVPNPSLSLEGGGLPLSRRLTVEAPGGPPELAVSLSFPLDWLLFGKRSAARAAAGAAGHVAEAEYANVVRLRVAETAQAFYSVLEAQALLQVARQALVDLEQTEAAYLQAVTSGGRPRVELARVRLELQAARREARSAQAALRSAQAKLQALLGSERSASARTIAGTLDGPLVIQPLPVEAAIALAARQRPDLRALRWKLAKAHRDALVEQRGAWPEVSVGLGVAHQFQRSIGARDATVWGLSLEMGLPIFDRNQGNRDKAASAAVQAAHELKAALLELRAEVRQAVLSLGTARENAAEMTQVDLKLAEQVRAHLRQAHAEGGRSLLEVLDAQRSYRETLRAHVTVRAEYWRALHQYQAALGGRLNP